MMIKTNSSSTDGGTCTAQTTATDQILNTGTLEMTLSWRKVKKEYPARDEFKSSISETEKSTVSKFSGTHFELHAFNSDDTQETEDINRVEEFNPTPISTQDFDSCFT
ncbi:hypothetical protein H5410_058569 [Solanum commersonii]|uniref:Uncharacterized protein n=1 Tax=Solanum commersonii TaxID=4109 RepID=A0A9J5WR74_SOLCO|nr:hypothetical protein H5410_058569 [Solanum commersonii]